MIFRFVMNIMSQILLYGDKLRMNDDRKNSFSRMNGRGMSILKMDFV